MLNSNLRNDHIEHLNYFYDAQYFLIGRHLKNSERRSRIAVRSYGENVVTMENVTDKHVVLFKRA